MSASDSDEAPEQLSFKNAKSAVEKEQHLVSLQKANEKLHAKLRRKMKDEVFCKQKLEKQAAKERRQEAIQSSSILDELRAEMSVGNLAPKAMQPTVESPQIVKKRRKVYKDLNIEVTTISQLKTDRPSSAASFRDRRLAKVPRESVTMNLIHAEKLSASGK